MDKIVDDTGRYYTGIILSKFLTNGSDVLLWTDK